MYSEKRGTELYSDEIESGISLARCDFQTVCTVWWVLFKTTLLLRMERDQQKVYEEKMIHYGFCFACLIN